MFAAMPRCLRLGLLAAVLTILLPATALAETFTVDPADANNACARGSDDVCKTISQAVSAAQTGDTINVLTGTYPEAVTIPSSLKDLTLNGADGVKLTGSGTSNVLTVQATGLK